MDIDALLNPEPLSTAALVLDLLLAFGLSSLVALYYVRFGEALANRVKFAKLLPILALITTLVISVVKASLALSLGLVGALSIVRFRTAIKEPEELIYLFMAIAIGLGAGADQRVPTLVSIALIMFLLIVVRLVSGWHARRRNFYLNVQVPDGKEHETATFQAINELLTDKATFVDLRRLDRINGALQLTYYLDCRDADQLTGLMDALNRRFPEATFTFIEQSNLPGV